MPPIMLFFSRHYATNYALKVAKMGKCVLMRKSQAKLVGYIRIVIYTTNYVVELCILHCTLYTRGVSCVRRAAGLLDRATDTAHACGVLRLHDLDLRTILVLVHVLSIVPDAR